MSANKKVITENTTKLLSIRKLLTFWLSPIWAILVLALVISTLVLTTSHFDWTMTARFLGVLLPVFLLLLAFMYVLWCFIPLWPLETGLIALFIVFLVFLIASGNNISFAPEIRGYLSKSFNMDFFGIAMTIGGLCIALWAIYKQQRKQK